MYPQWMRHNLDPTAFMWIRQWRQENTDPSFFSLSSFLPFTLFSEKEYYPTVYIACLHRAPFLILHLIRSFHDRPSSVTSSILPSSCIVLSFVLVSPPPSRSICLDHVPSEAQYPVNLLIQDCRHGLKLVLLANSVRSQPSNHSLVACILDGFPNSSQFYGMVWG